MYFLWIAVLVILCNKCDYGGTQLTEICQLDSGNTGKCVLIDQCPAAVEIIKMRAYPQLCGFEKLDPIICCETPKDLLVKSGEPESKAKQKCLEYTSITTPTTTTTTTRSPKQEMQHLKPFVIDGVNAFPLEFPHMALLGYGDPNDIQWQCGGTLISETFILTAAHCINSRHGKVAFVNLGLHQLNLITYHVQTFNVTNTYQHPNYSSFMEYNDIALIELDRKVNLNTGVKPACLQVLKKVSNDILIATGWGATEVGGENNDILQKVNLTEVPFDTCSVTYKPQRRLINGILDDSQICAGSVIARGDTCQGDSGGPLQFRNEEDSLYSVVGITSFGIKCGILPGVYTRVSHYVPWIESIVWPN